MADIKQVKVGSTTYNVYDVEGRKEENLQWGGGNQVGNVSPIGMALSNEHSANRMAFINGNCITAEYSSDGGATWANYTEGATAKSQFFTSSYAFNIGRQSSSTEYTTNSRTRITITAQDGTNGYVYTDPKKMLINVSSSGGMQVLIEYRTGTNYKSGGAWSTFGTYTVSGWSGWNDIPLILGTLGGGTTQTSNNWQLRLTFIMTSKSTAYPTTASVTACRIYGSNSWTTPSTTARTGHLYDFDMSQNVTFPAIVTAPTFYGNLTGTASTATYASSATTATYNNTAGATNTSSKIFLVGATSQGATPQTYSHDTAFVDTAGCINSVTTATNDNSTKVATTAFTQSAIAAAIGAAIDDYY